jgi:competence protein ComEA
LGGFIAQGQLYDVYGLDSLVIKRLQDASFIEENFKPRQINMNTADEIEFSSHPYIKKFVARVIVAYRKQHGNYQKVEDIRNIKLLQAAEADKLIPYLKVD